MLLTNLLSTNATSEAKRPVEKRKAIEGRLLELASFAPTGQGSKSSLSTSSANLSSHPAKIRTGIIQAQAKRDEKARREAEASGNKVRGMRGLGEMESKRGSGERDRAMMGAEVGKKKGMESRKKGDAARDRGLGMGIGRFDRGMLKLSEREIARGSEERRGGGRGKGGGRGGRGRRGSGGGGGRGGRVGSGGRGRK